MAYIRSMMMAAHMAAAETVATTAEAMAATTKAVAATQAAKGAAMHRMAAERRAANVMAGKAGSAA